VEDVVTRGGRVQETIDIARKHEAQVIGIAMAVDRSNGSVNFGVPTLSLLRMHVETFDPANVPADLVAIPAIKPGSK
jgi:orotate phosphoribosyltransferase